MSNEVFFSVIIPTYNRCEFINKAIESCLVQDFDNIEVIVIDDGSTDNTEKSVQGVLDARVKYFKITNGERGRARNVGVSKSIGRYVFFLDSDDYLAKSHFSSAYDFLEKKVFPEFLFTGITFVDSKDNFLFKSTNFENEIPKEIILKNNICASAFFLRKDVAEQHPFSEERSLSGSEDRLLTLMLSKHYQLFFSNKQSYFLVDHTERSMASVDESNWNNQFTFLKKGIVESQLFLPKEVKVILSNFKQMVAIKLLQTKAYKSGFKWFLESAYSIGSILNKNTLRIVKFGVLKPMRTVFNFTFLLLGILYCVTILNLFTKEKIRDYSELLKTSPENRVLYLDSLSLNSFEFDYAHYSFLDNPLSSITNKFKTGVSQVADPEYLYNYCIGGYCGQQSQFLGAVANEMGLNYRYVWFEFEHIGIEIESEENIWVYFDPVQVINRDPLHGDEEFNLLDYESLFQNKNFEIGEGLDGIVPQLGKYTHHKVNHDIFRKLYWFNKITWCIWFVGFPLLLLAFIGVKLDHKKNKNL